MTERTTRRSVTFTRPFSLSGIDREQPAGAYMVETDEELVDGLSFAAYRRTATRIYLPARRDGGGAAAEVADIDPQELDAALAADGVPEAAAAVEPTAAEQRAEAVLKQAGARTAQLTPREREERSQNLADLLETLYPQ